MKYKEKKEKYCHAGNKDCTKEKCIIVWLPKTWGNEITNK